MPRWVTWRIWSHWPVWAITAFTYPLLVLALGTAVFDIGPHPLRGSILTVIVLAYIAQDIRRARRRKRRQPRALAPPETHDSLSQ